MKKILSVLLLLTMLGGAGANDTFASEDQYPGMKPLNTVPIDLLK